MTFFKNGLVFAAATATLFFAGLGNAELFTTTFCSFLREFSPLSRHRVPERSDGPDYFWHVG